MKVPLNRVVAFVGPYITVISSALAAWLVAKVNVLGIPGLDKANVATWIAAALTALVTAAVHALGGWAWLKGHHIQLANTSPTIGDDGEGPGDPDALPNIPATDAASVPPRPGRRRRARGTRRGAHAPPARCGGGEARDRDPARGMSASASGLSARHRAQARRVLVHGCELLLEHAPMVHYTMGPARWSAITRGLRIAEGQFLTEGDCSSTATWLLWNALTHVHPRASDIVNGLRWHAGYTGTIAQHGKLVRHDANIQVGDLILYGRGWPYEHVAVALGGGMAFSHGGEQGPFKVRIDYRPDRAMVRRFI